MAEGRRAPAARGPGRVRQAVLWGAAGHAKVLRECLAHAGVRVVALFDNDPAVASPLPGVPVFHGPDGFDTWRKRAGRGPVGFLVAIGGERGRDRVDLHHWLRAQGLTPLVARHPTAFVAADAVLAPGCQVLAQACVAVEARLGDACIVNTAASVDHECVLEEGVHVAPGARLAGRVWVGPCATIGAGAVVLPRLQVGHGAVVGAGAVVTRDVDPYTVVAGNPARPVGRREPRT